MSTIKIPLHSRKHPGLFATISTTDLPLVAGHSWYPRKSKWSFYAFSADNLGPEPMHAFILPKQGSLLVDHINGNTLDNRSGNLRHAPSRSNARNRGVQKNNTTGFKGVTRLSEDGKWRAQIYCGENRKKHNLGLFKTADDAAHAYDVAARELYGEFARLNFPLANEIGTVNASTMPSRHTGPAVIWAKPGSHIQNKAVPIAQMEEATHYHASSPDLEHETQTHIVVDAECREEAVAMVHMAVVHLLSRCRSEGVEVPAPVFTPGLTAYWHPDMEEPVETIRSISPATSLIWEIPSSHSGAAL